ncbi:MAG: methyltransferase domain-containing protein [Actinomycetota bacterium]|nr:methyltransferase domain-containing protein [Actinomycetota bacterium]
MEVDLRKANEIFHDYESELYDSKWGILFDEKNAQRVKKKFEKLLGAPFPRVEKLLEVGCGTGYVGLNLCLNDGLVGNLYACDISEGMVEACCSNASKLGIKVEAKKSELESLAYPDNEFDMVIGHAILHHIPDIRKAFEEILRVLRPGGICMLAGEPTRTGDFLGRIARRSTLEVLKLYTRLGGRFGGKKARLREEGTSDSPQSETKELETLVDIHTFKPREVAKIAIAAGFEDVRYECEELLSAFVGWITRTIDNSLSEENLTVAWRFWCYNTYVKLSKLDERIYAYLPSELFYNMLLYMEKPE